MLQRPDRTALNRLTASQITDGVSTGEFTCEQVLGECLDRIDAREKVVQAWACADRELALAQARRRDCARAPGPLHGVPIGIKDNIDTADLPTQMGSPIFQGHRPAADAACVAQLRAAGAVILGKTVTCEFAGMTPSVTTNPHNPDHTPGGSSSGSGAAVADFMVPVALGTQTGGSVLRPASYCGVFGFKPSFGAFNRRGVYPAAESLDTVGLMARSLEDIELVSAVLQLRTSLAAGSELQPKIGLCRTPLWDKAQPATVSAIDDAATRLAKAGASIREVVLTPAFAALPDAARETINNYERAGAMAWEWNTHRQEISPRLRTRLETGRATAHADYRDALQLGEDCRKLLPNVFGNIDVLLAPCTNGEAPRGLGDTGDPAFQAIWTILYVPTLSLPTHYGPSGLPVGIQLVGQRHRDSELLACARWIWRVLGSPELIGVRA
ncbi:MAG: amidase [Xanthobacteraceae bacterium]